MRDDLRTFYAKLVTAKGGSRWPELVAAFASVDRGAYLGAGPWKVYTSAGYIETPSDDEAFIWQDVAVALDAQRTINNGEPSLHARCIAALAPRTGEHILHVGTGSGYYTTLLARLVGPDGAVDAYEIDADLAARAAVLLAPQAQVRLHVRSGAEGPLPPADAIYVNAGASAPSGVWLDALKPGGRLLFPLTTDQGNGLMLLVTRGAETRFEARVLMGVGFIPCVGARDARESDALSKALAAGGAQGLRSLRREGTPDDSAWLVGDGWWLSLQDAS